MVDCHKYQRKYFELIVGEAYKFFHTVLLSQHGYIIAKNEIRFKGKLEEALLSNHVKVSANKKGHLMEFGMQVVCKRIEFCIF